MKAIGRRSLPLVLFLLAGLLYLPAPAAARMPRLTQSTNQIAQGLTLTKIDDPSGPNRIRVLTVDPLSASVSLDMASAGRLPSLKTTSAMAQADGAIAAINGDFGAFEGRPLHAFGVDGALLQTGFQTGVSFAVSHDEQHLFVGPSRAKVVGRPIPSGAAFGVNRWNEDPAGSGQIAAFSPYGGSQQPPPTGECEVQLRRSSGLHWDANQSGVYRDYTVTTKTCGGAALRFSKRKGKVILEARTSGAGSTTLRALQIASTVRMSWKMIDASPWTGVMEMIGGMPLLVDNGNVVAKSCSSYFCSRNPRTGIGYTASGKVLLVTVDGRENGSVGMTLVGFAQEMKSLGAIEAVNLDGGGSTTMWVKGSGLVNVPADSTGERAIPNAVLVLPSSGEKEPNPLVATLGPEPASSTPELSSQLEMSDPGSTGGLMQALSEGAFGGV